MNDKPLVLNLHEILRSRLSRRANMFLPGFVISLLEKIIHQDDLNEILRVTHPHTGSKFSRKVLEHLDINLEVKGIENLEEGKRYMFASNHPLGGLDGISLIAVLGERYGDDNMRFLVNDMLLNVIPLKSVFLPINKFGAQGREATKAINETFASGKQVLQFPAGLVSRLQKGGKISDLQWHKAFAAKAIEYQRDIIPIRFKALNSSRFYKFARWRKRLGIKFNIEQILLPGEVCRSRGKHFQIIFGNPIRWKDLKESGKSPVKIASEIRDLVYTL